MDAFLKIIFALVVVLMPGGLVLAAAAYAVKQLRDRGWGATFLELAPIRRGRLALQRAFGASRK